MHKFYWFMNPFTFRSSQSHNNLFEAISAKRETMHTPKTGVGMRRERCAAGHSPGERGDQRYISLETIPHVALAASLG